MNAYLNYVIEANMGLLLFTIMYFILFEKETQFTFRRWFLLISIAASLVFPLIEFNTTQPVIPSIANVVPSTYLPEVAVNEIQPTAASMGISYWDIAGTVYGIIVGALLLLFCIRVGRLILYLKRSVFVRDGKFRIIESAADHPTFSFFHYIFIGNTNQLDQYEKEQIINHEKLHATHVHSLDLLVSETLKILFWFNPVVYVLKNQLVSIHEFEADQQAVQHQDPDLYCDLLARTSLTAAGFSLANHFHNSLTLKRIVMINSKKTKMKGWKYFTVIPMLAIGFVAISCQDQVLSELKEVAASSSQVTTYPEEVANQLKQLQAQHPGDEYMVIEVNEEGKEKLKKLDIKNIGQGEEYKNVNFIYINPTTAQEGRSFVILVKGTLTDKFSELSKTEGDVYTIVDAPATPGNKADLAKFLQRNLKYPAEARNMREQGKVFISMIVEKDGTLSNHRVAQNLSPALDAEALRVASLLAAWNPARNKGEAVRAKVILPIEFKLDGVPQNLSASTKEPVGEKSDVVSITGYAPVQSNPPAVFDIPQANLPVAFDTSPDSKIYEAVEQAPTFPGGMPAYREFMAKELHYPENARSNHITGKVFVAFVVDTEGNLSDIGVLSGIGFGCNEEALRVVSKFPKWNPGKQNGKPVHVRYIVPILFGTN